MKVVAQMASNRSVVLAFLYVGVVLHSNAMVSLFAPNFIPMSKFSQVSDIAIATAMYLCPLLLFAFARFSFGYIVGLYMYGMVAGYIVLSYSSDLSYDHSAARISALLSLIAFLIPALFLRLRGPDWSLSEANMNRVLVGLVIVCAAILAIDYGYGFRVAGVMESLDMRSEIARPKLLNYANGIITCAVLPFAFAHFAINRRWLMAGLSLVLLAGFFPILLNKTVLVTPIWLVYLLVLYRLFRPITATALAISLPVILGIVSVSTGLAYHPFGFINIRMVAVPSSAMDHYFEFFSAHPLTHFCQIGLVKAVTGCAYTEQLGVVLQKQYNLGNFNGSLFTTEGIASVGPKLAPLITFVCGIVIGLGNVASSRLSPLLVAVSSSIVVQSLMNVPLSTVMLSNGGAALFLLWLLSPAERHGNAGNPARDALAKQTWALRSLWWYRSPDLVDPGELDTLITAGLVEMKDGRPMLTPKGLSRISADH